MHEKRGGESPPRPFLSHGGARYWITPRSLLCPRPQQLEGSEHADQRGRPATRGCLRGRSGLLTPRSGQHSLLTPFARPSLPCFVSVCHFSSSPLHHHSIVHRYSHLVSTTTYHQSSTTEPSHITTPPRTSTPQYLSASVLLHLLLSASSAFIDNTSADTFHNARLHLRFFIITSIFITTYCQSQHFNSRILSIISRISSI